MKITSEVYEFTPQYAVIELSGIKPNEVEELRNKRVTVVLRNVCLVSSQFSLISPNCIEAELKFWRLQ